MFIFTFVLCNKRFI